MTTAEAQARYPLTQGVNPWLVTVSVMLPTFMEVLDTAIASVALPYIAGSLSSTNSEATWVLTSYLVANAVILPASTGSPGGSGASGFCSPASSFSRLRRSFAERRRPWRSSCWRVFYKGRAGARFNRFRSRSCWKVSHPPSDRWPWLLMGSASWSRQCWVQPWAAG